MDSNLKFGKVEVSCEGYDYPEDPYVFLSFFPFVFFFPCFLSPLFLPSFSYCFFNTHIIITGLSCVGHVDLNIPLSTQIKAVNNNSSNNNISISISNNNNSSSSSNNITRTNINLLITQTTTPILKVCFVTSSPTFPFSSSFFTFSCCLIINYFACFSSF